uniref:Peptidase S1 domain-containing protein n=1 Tax=Anopheles maculatus TaxID=74869 RepID=A0A182SK63_9DIPT
MNSPFWIFVLLGLSLSAVSQTSHAQEYQRLCGRRKVKSLSLRSTQNGVDAEPGQWPWHAIVFRKDDIGGINYKCGGTIIDESIVLTSAHCVFGNGVLKPTKLSIHVGRIHLTEEYTQKFDAKEIMLHPKFSGTKVDNDIALIRLASNITMTRFVQPVCLWTLDDNPNLIVGKNGTIVGFSLTEQKIISEHLKQTSVGVVDALTCASSDRETLENLLTPKMICAGGQEGGCRGNGGGGMFFEVEGRWFVRAIVSFTPRLTQDGLCDPSVNTVFTDVAKYIDWIRNYIDPGLLPIASERIELGPYVDGAIIFPDD